LDEHAQNGKRDTNGRSAEDDGSAGRGPLIGLGAIVLIGLVAWLLFRELSASSRLQDCLLSGRTNCAPIETPTR
jgi:hypothetical protein